MNPPEVGRVPAGQREDLRRNCNWFWPRAADTGSLIDIRTDLTALNPLRLICQIN